MPCTRIKAALFGTNDDLAIGALKRKAGAGEHRGQEVVESGIFDFRRDQLIHGNTGGRDRRAIPLDFKIDLPGQPLDHFVERGAFERMGFRPTEPKA